MFIKTIALLSRLKNIKVLSSFLPTSSFGNSRANALMKEHEQDMRQKRKIISVIGGPGSGKGTQCLNLKEKYNFCHISSGDLLREELRNKGPLSEQLTESMKQGKLVSSELVIQLIKNKIDQTEEGTTILLDGFPRNQQNLQLWNKLHGQTLPISTILSLSCSKTTMKQRLLSRGKTSNRADDNSECIDKRLQVYEKETKEVMEMMEKEEGKIVIKIDGDQGPREVFWDLRQKLGELGY